MSAPTACHPNWHRPATRDRPPGPAGQRGPGGVRRGVRPAHRPLPADRQLLDEAGLPHARGHSYFDVRPYVILPAGHGFAGLTGALCLRDGGHSLAANPPAVGAGFRYASGPLLTDPGSFLVPADTAAPGPASGDDWGAPWHAAERPWGDTEALDRFFAAGGLAPAGRAG